MPAGCLPGECRWPLSWEPAQSGLRTYGVNDSNPTRSVSQATISTISKWTRSIYFYRQVLLPLHLGI